MREAVDTIEDGITDSLSIVRCKYSAKHECWFEILDGGSIEIHSHNWIDDEEFQARREARRQAKALAKLAKAGFPSPP